MPLSNTKIALAFLFLTVMDCMGIVCNIPLLHEIAKPLLLPFLIVLLFIGTKPGTQGRMLLFTALFFSWLGDIFLLLEDKNQLFFIFGLTCFLTTHIFYIIYFLRIRSAAVSLLKKQPFFIVLVAGYGIALVWFLFPHLKELTIPVMVYAVVICSMLLCSVHIYFKVSKPANAFFVFGALLFVLSDSLLAVDKFYQPFAFAGVCIMLTYCAAQYFIVTGFIKQHNND